MCVWPTRPTARRARAPAERSPAASDRAYSCSAARTPRFPWLAATRHPTVNLGSLYLTEELAAILVGTNVDLVVVPNPEAMYSTTSWPFAAVIDGTRDFTPKTTRRPIVLNYPLSDSDRLLLHPLFAHEIAHASVNEHNLVAAVEAHIAGEQAFPGKLQQTVTAMKADWPITPEAVIEKTLRAMLGSWIEELLCDHLAADAMGPAFLFAFASFVMPLSYGEPGRSHPPTTLRVRLILEHLQTRGWADYLYLAAPALTDWLRSVAADAENELPQPYDFFREQLLAHAATLQQTATDTLAANSLDAQSAAPEAAQATTLLESRILPLGLGRPLKARAILLGGWQAAISAHSDRPEGLVSALSDNQLQDLVGKAMEMTTVVNVWSPAP